MDIFSEYIVLVNVSALNVFVVSLFACVQAAAKSNNGSDFASRTLLQQSCGHREASM